MEHVEAILYHRIQDSDFTNMYGIKKPVGGGGQTYIQAAGYSRDALDKMFSDADAVFDTPEFWDAEKLYPRKRYTVNAFAVGSAESGPLELAPRTGRKDYRISRQNSKYRHPAWQPSHGFPVPNERTIGDERKYVYEKNYPGIIDDLYILIIKTRREDGARAFYADYVKAKTLPPAWPSGAGLESIFASGKQQGILFFSDQYLRFANDKDCPFRAGSAADDVLGAVALPPSLPQSTEDAVEFAGKALDISIDYDAVSIHRVDAPANKPKRGVVAAKSVCRNTDYERRYKNLKRIGDIGERLALEIERRRLASEGRADLSRLVEHVSATIGDGLGYDIRSYEKRDGRYVEKYIEVKATTGGRNKPFAISANEVAASEEKGDQYAVYRFFGVGGKSADAWYYEVRGAIKDHFALVPTEYKAYCKE